MLWTLFAVSILNIALAFLLNIVLNTLPESFLSPEGMSLAKANPGWLLPLNPEPHERTIFLINIFLSFSLILLGTRFVNKNMLHSPTVGGRVIYAFLAVAFIFVSTRDPHLNAIVFELGTSWSHMVFMCFACAILMILSLSDVFLARRRRKNYLVFGASAFCLTLLVQILPWRIASIREVSLSHTWSISFDAAISSLSQVIGGKTVLADIPSQYGLYPEILSPLFTIFPASVLSVTLIFAALQLVSVLSMQFMIFRFTKSTVLAAVGCLSILVPTCLFLFLSGNREELYFQYFPIRLLFPAVSLLIFYSYCIRRSRALLLVLSIFSGISLAWNLDSGMAVFMAINMWMIARAAIDSRSREIYIKRLAIYIFFSVFTLLAFLAYLSFKASALIDISLFTYYQRIFYGAGFGMIPMPTTLHPWQLIICIYIAGIAVALIAWRKGLCGVVYDIIFYISALGLVLFIYYQGRSHPFCLMMVMWPAFINGIILTERLARVVRIRREMPHSLFVVMPILFILSACASAVLNALPVLTRESLKITHKKSIASRQLVSEELEFMNGTQRGRRCLILSKRQAIYHIELGTSSPAEGPGLVESVLMSDARRLANSIKPERIPCIYLGKGRESEPFLEIDADRLYRQYYTAGRNKSGSILLLEPRRRENPD